MGEHHDALSDFEYVYENTDAILLKQYFNDMYNSHMKNYSTCT